LANSYDSQPHNVLLAIDDGIFDSLLKHTSVRSKIVVDVGCGTGRHWERLLAGEPAQLIGYDASLGMLKRLRSKYPHATTRVTIDHQLPELHNDSCDVVVSTLTFGYLPDHSAVLAEWSRVLKPGGEVILTDLHPVAATSGERSFCHLGKTISIRHYVYPLDTIIASARQHGLGLLRLEERRIDEGLRAIYEAQNAGQLFARTFGLPLMYGLFPVSKSWTELGD
jgi:ubiquinone/menaquinone biosynthesis C-methylase UbiE